MSEWKTVQPKAGGEHTTWVPEVGETIEGVLTERPVLGPNKSEALIIEDAMGNTSLVWSNAVLKDRLESVQIGTEVRIKFLGKVTGKTGRAYNNYEVQVKE